MPRQRKDGRPLPGKQVVKFTAKFMESLKPGPDRQTFYDSKLAGFALRLEPSGHAAFKLVYRRRKRPVWFNLGSVDRYPGEEGVTIVRAKCMQLLLQMAKDDAFDPQGYRVAEKSGGTFGEDLAAYLMECEKKLRAPEQKARLLTTVFLGAWETLQTRSITQADVQHVLAKCKRKPTSKDSARTHLSAFFRWARKKQLYAGDNPCTDVEVEDAKINARARVLGVEEIPLFWEALETLPAKDALALKLTFLTGARIGECQRIRFQDIQRTTIKLPVRQRGRLLAEGRPAPESVTGLCWVQPGKADEANIKDRKAGKTKRMRRGWGGTKNGEPHRYWLPQPVVDLLGGDPGDRTGPLFNARKDLSKAMQKVSAAMGLAEDNVTPHDLRRTFTQTITWADYSDEAMHRIVNHTPDKLTKTYTPAQKLEEAWEVSNAVVTELLKRTKAPSAESVVA